MKQTAILNTCLSGSGFLHLAAGLSVGLTGLAAGYAIGVVGDVVSCISLNKTIANAVKGVRSYMQQSRIFVGMVLILIFSEVLGLYGFAHLPMFDVKLRSNDARLIVALLLNTRTD